MTWFLSFTAICLVVLAIFIWHAIREWKREKNEQSRQ